MKIWKYNVSIYMIAELDYGYSDIGSLKFSSCFYSSPIRLNNVINLVIL